MKTLERRLVDTLRNEAEGLPDEEAAHTLTPVRTRRQGFLRPGMAAPAAVLVVMVLAAPVIWFSTGRGGGELTEATQPTSPSVTAQTSQPAVTTTPATAPEQAGLESVLAKLPNDFEPELAIPLFAMDASPKETAMQYLGSRNLTTSVGVSRVVEQGEYTLVQWAWGRFLDGSEQEQGERGWLLMSSTTAGYEIIAATTDGVDLSGLHLTDGRLQGVVQGSAGDGLGIDVLGLDETPVASAPNPEGMPDADYLWGTAGAGEPPLTLDLSVTGPVIVRVNRVGGALVSISEVILGQAGPFIDSPFIGDGWQLIVGEAPNPPTDTYKVCHNFAPDEDPNEANGFGPSGCVTWPDDTTDATDNIIIDAIPFATPDAQSLLFVDLTAEAFDTVSVVLGDGSTVDVAPFAMPASGKQFAVVELPTGADTAEIQLLDAGTVVESQTVDIPPTD